jgi:endonuclease/exonuclease/phosphatase family metal-dependent hydrolase
MKMFKTLAALAALSLLAANGALAKPKADIKVMTQNQYLGADLTPIIEAEGPIDFNTAVITALIEIGNNNLPERAVALAESISDKQPHLVALQEMYAFECEDFGNGQCGLFQAAFNDHLALTMQALDGQYEVAAVVQNLTLPPADIPIPGIPVFLAANSPPAFFVRVIDRDVILARADVDTTVVDFACADELVSLDGCNFDLVATTPFPNPAGGDPIEINIERGYVGVDAIVDGASYRFINTHLEVKVLGNNPASVAIQAIQASELWGAILANFDPSQRLIVAGDFNSSPADPALAFPPFGGTLHRPYQQFANGTLFAGQPLFFPLTDIWTLRPGKPDGFTCCELEDLSNAVSQHGERVDIVFAFPAPASVKANVVDAKTNDKTRSGHWPSDHASVSAELAY